jgi:hypothetical protein
LPTRSRRDVDAEHGEQLTGQAAGCDTGRGLTGAGPLENGPHSTHVLDRAGEVGVAGTGPVDVVEFLEFGVLVDHLESQRAAERDAAPKPGQEGDGVGFDPLPSAAAIPALATLQLGVDRGYVDRQSGGKPIDQGHECGPV